MLWEYCSQEKKKYIKCTVNAAKSEFQKGVTNGMRVKPNTGDLKRKVERFCQKLL